MNTQPRPYGLTSDRTGMAREILKPLAAGLSANRRQLTAEEHTEKISIHERPAR